MTLFQGVTNSSTGEYNSCCKKINYYWK